MQWSKITNKSLNWLVYATLATTCCAAPPTINSADATYVTPTTAHGSGTHSNSPSSGMTGATSNGGAPGGNSGATSGATPAPTPGMRLQSRLGTLCLDIVNAATAPGTPVRVWQCNGVVGAQSWQLIHGQVRALGDRCLDLAPPPPAGVGPGLVVNPCDPNFPPSQQFDIDNGAVTHLMSGTGGGAADANRSCLAVQNGNAINGTPVLFEPCVANNEAQHWSGNGDNPNLAVGFAIFLASDNNRCVVPSNDGSVAALASCNDANARAWTMQTASVGGTAFVVGGACLTADTPQNGSVPTLAACTGLANQNWQIHAGMIAPSAAPTLCLQAASADAGPTAPMLNLVPCQPSTSAQQWSLGTP